MLEMESESGKGKPKFTWRESFECDVLVAIQDAEIAAAKGDGHVHDLLKGALAANGNLRAKLRHQPKKGYARRMVLSGVFPRHRNIILDFIDEVTGETRYH